MVTKPFIFIYGPPGVGKSTLGALLAQSLAEPFIDLDEQIAQQTHLPISKIFEMLGESSFRTLEQQAMQSLLDEQPAVVALGGGALLNATNRKLAEDCGQVLALTADIHVLQERLKKQTEIKRPLLSDNLTRKLAMLLETRAEHYHSFPLQLNTGTLSSTKALAAAQILLSRFHIHSQGTGYDVTVQAGGLPDLGAGLRMRKMSGPFALVADDQVAGIYAKIASRSLQQAGFQVTEIFFSHGEQNKTLQTIQTLWASFLEAGLDRHSTVIGLGGGVTTDLAGFAAATFMRGIPWVAVPTSLLGMVDASIGGKTGCDLPQGKNLVGAFHPPKWVFADPEMLDTLPKEEYRSGMAEIVKHGVIADPVLFMRCQENAGPFSQSDISRAMAVKIEIIQHDPREKGLRLALNYGHTVGHAIETASAYRIRHGEAVSIGMVAEARLAEQIGLAQDNLSTVIADTLRSLELPVEIPSEISRQEIIQHMKLDKKRREQQPCFSLPARIGMVEVNQRIPDWQLLINKL